VNSGTKIEEYTKVYRPADRVRDFEISLVELPPNQKTNLKILPVTSLLLCTSGTGSVSAASNSLNVRSGQCIVCPAGFSVEVSSDESLTIFRANRNQGTPPNDSVLNTIAKILFQEIPSLSGEELKAKALQAAELFRSVDQYVSDIWFRAAGYQVIGDALSKSVTPDSSDDVIRYTALRWLQKALHIFDLAGDAVNDSPITIPFIEGVTVVPSTLKQLVNVSYSRIPNK